MLHPTKLPGQGYNEYFKGDHYSPGIALGAMDMAGIQAHPNLYVSVPYIC